MALSEYEANQFNELTANFSVDDTSAVKKMEHRDKARSMSYSAFPSFFTWANLHSLLLCAGLVMIVVTVLARVARDEQMTFTAGGIGLLIILGATFIPFSQKKTEDAEQ